MRYGLDNSGSPRATALATDIISSIFYVTNAVSQEAAMGGGSLNATRAGYQALAGQASPPRLD